MIRTVVVTLLFSLFLHAISFSEAIQVLNKHESVSSLSFKRHATKEMSKLKSSWGDPVIKLAAKNFPQDSLSSSQTPMTGVELSLSQKIPLTSKYSTIQSSFEALSQAYHYDAKDKKERLAKAFWEILIAKKEIGQKLAILKDNAIWIEKILKVSKRLYATGKVSQQALLEIEIRKSVLQRDISNKNFERSQINDKLTYLLGTDDIKDDSVPWGTLEKESDLNIDYRELSLLQKLKVKEQTLLASKQDYIPDVTLSVGYTKRSDIDNQGDFVSAAVSFKLPFSDQKSSQYGVALQEKLRTQQDYAHYKRLKSRDIALLSHEIEKVTQEIDILDNKMIKFATNSREITSKSYETGDSTYIELLQSELNLQKILMDKVSLEAKRDRQRVARKYLKGEALYE